MSIAQSWGWCTQGMLCLLWLLLLGRKKAEKNNPETKNHPQKQMEGMCTKSPKQLPEFFLKFLLTSFSCFYLHFSHIGVNPFVTLSPFFLLVHISLHFSPHTPLPLPFGALSPWLLRIYPGHPAGSSQTCATHWPCCRELPPGPHCATTHYPLREGILHRSCLWFQA